MKINLKKNRAVVALVSLLVLVNVGLLGFVVSARMPKKLDLKSDCRSSHERIPDAVARTCWDAIIGFEGSQKATQDFIAWNNGFNVDTQHTYAHVFGGLLYKNEGKVGLQYCTSDFAFGCYHEFLGKAIGTEGLKVAKELNDACFKYIKRSPLSCQHGIGHGVLASIGYEDDKLTPALEVCRELPYNDSIGGCYGGVFMEYNMRTMLGANAAARTMDPAHYDICPTLDKAYGQACYYWITQWWVVSMISEANGPTSTVSDTVPERLGKWCRAGLPEYHEQCFRGTGNIAGQSTGYVIDKTIRFCKLAAAGDEKSLAYCLQDSANSYATLPQYKETAIGICKPLTGELLEGCKSRLRNEGAKVE